MLNEKNYKTLIMQILCIALTLNLCVCLIDIVFNNIGLKTAWAAEEEKYEKEHTETFIVYAIEKNSDGTYDFSYMNPIKNSNRFDNFNPSDYNKTVITPASKDKLEIIEKYFGINEYKLYLKTP